MRWTAWKAGLTKARLTQAGQTSAGLTAVWPLVQQSAAAVVAWLIAVRIAGHADPFFAPVAAVVGLNATVGRRGSNAVRLLAGVLIGVVVGGFAVWFTGNTPWTLAAATFLALLLARALDNARIVQAQAAVSAVLVVILGHPQQGWDRLIDAVIGAAVALTFSQLLFTPEPLRLLRRAEAVVLSQLAGGLRMTSDALAHRDRERAEAATTTLRNLRDDLAELGAMRLASDRITRHSLTGWRRADLVVAEREQADHLDLLAGSCLMLSRTVTAVGEPVRQRLAVLVRELAAAMNHLARDPGDRPLRQRAAEQAADLASWLVGNGGPMLADPAATTAYASVRMVAADMMVFAGVDPQQAFRAGDPGPPKD